MTDIETVLEDLRRLSTHVECGACAASLSTAIAMLEAARTIEQMCDHNGVPPFASLDPDMAMPMAISFKRAVLAIRAAPEPPEGV